MDLFFHFGWAGSLIILAGCFLSALPYRDRDGEKYSLFNHFISELGEVGVSERARVFNTGMVLGGLLFLPFIASIGWTLSGLWAVLGTAAGIVAAGASVFVGIYSMERLEPHRKAAMTFFRAGLLTIILFTVAVFLQPSSQRVIPILVNVIGMLAIAAYAAFLVIVSHKTNKKGEQNYILDPSVNKTRPRFWITAFLEWTLFFATIAWFLCVSLVLIK